MNENSTLVGCRQTYAVDEVVFTMRYAPAGSFLIEFAGGNRATVRRPFWIAETAVTYELYDLVWLWALEHGYTFRGYGREGSDGYTGDEPTERRLEPVVMLWQKDCMLWCNALSELFGYPPVYLDRGEPLRSAARADGCHRRDEGGFRLPSYAEWALAARYQGEDSSGSAVYYAGCYWTPLDFASGATSGAIEAVEEVAWWRGNCQRTQPVGRKRPNRLGLYDMSGNVMETCLLYGETTAGSQFFQWVLCGGSFLSGSTSAVYVDSGEVHASRDVRVHSAGFRIVRTAASDAKLGAPHPLKARATSQKQRVSDRNKKRLACTVEDISFAMRLALESRHDIGTAFWVAETQVTNSLWEAIREWSKRHGYGKAISSHCGASDIAVSVAWYDCMLWCNALSEWMGLPPVYTFEGEVIRGRRCIEPYHHIADDSRCGFRLPRVSEWAVAERLMVGTNTDWCYDPGWNGIYDDYRAIGGGGRVPSLPMHCNSSFRVIRTATPLEVRGNRMVYQLPR